MPQKTPIEWTDYTSNPIYAVNRETGKRGWFCVKISPGCGHCYSEAMNVARLGNGLRFTAANIDKVEFILNSKELRAIIKLDRSLAKKGQRAKLFPCDMTDLFFEKHTNNFLDLMFCTFALCPNIDFQVLTKRAERMLAYFSTPNRKRTLAEKTMVISNILACDGGHAARITKNEMAAAFEGTGPLKNVWLGVSVENQEAANERIPFLLETPATVRWLSIEPLLGPVDLTHIQFPNEHGNTEDWNALDRCIMPNGLDDPTLMGVDDPIIDWVIVGGESGPHARPMHPEWTFSLRDQCFNAGVPFFFKQVGEWASPADPAFGKTNGEGKIRVIRSDGSFWENPPEDENADAVSVVRVGKKAAGRLLGNREWNEFPN